MLATQKSCPTCQGSAQHDGASCGCGGSHSGTIQLHDHKHDHDHEHDHDHGEQPQDIVKLFDSLSDQTSMIRDVQLRIMRKALAYLALLVGAAIAVIAGIVWLTKWLGWW